MNILYLGPYRQNNELGIVSRSYLDTLLSIGNVTSQPVFLDNLNIDKNIQFASENNRYDTYDYLVQHLPICKSVFTQSIKKNICIPIIDNNLISDDEHKKLSLFYKILTDTPYSYSLFKQTYKTKTKAIKPNLQIPTDINTYDLGFFNVSKKIYCILDYRKNAQLIQTLIDSFAIASKHQTNHSYVLFVYNLNPNDTQHIHNLIKTRYDSIRSKSKIINTILIPCGYDETAMLAAHNTGDIFLNITESLHSPLHYHYATLCKKGVIDVTNINTVSSYLINNEYHQDACIKYSPENIVDAILNLSIHKTKLESRILLPEILC